MEMLSVLFQYRSKDRSAAGQGASGRPVRGSGDQADQGASSSVDEE